MANPLLIARTIGTLANTLRAVNGTVGEENQAVGLLANYARRAARSGATVFDLPSLTSEEKAATHELVDVMHAHGATEALVSAVGFLSFLIPSVGAATTAAAVGAKYNNFMSKRGVEIGSVTDFVFNLSDSFLGGIFVTAVASVLAPVMLLEMALQAIGATTNAVTPAVFKSDAIAPLSAYIIGQAANMVLGESKAESLLARQMQHGEEQGRGR